MSVSVWVINLVVLGVLLEADLGRRKIGPLRVLRPLLSAAAIVSLYLTAVPAWGHNPALMLIGAGVGVLLGVACHAFLRVEFDPSGGKQGLAVSEAGFGYALFWLVVFAVRLGFEYGASHWFESPLGRFLGEHQLGSAGLTDSLIFMALALALTRSLVLAVRGSHARQQGASVARELAAA
jgi:hypothetical protein